MAVEIIFPKVDMDMTQGRIARWFAKAGDKVVKGQPLFEIETDKAAMEIDAPADGILDNMTAKEGANVPVGEVVAWIYAEGEERKQQDQHITIPVMDVKAVMAESAAKQQMLNQHARQAPPKKSISADKGEGGHKIRATPLARRLAREAGIELATLQGSGPHGRIQRQDVEVAQSTHYVKQTISHVSQPIAATSSDSGRNGDLLHAVWLREGERGQLPVVLIHGFGADLNSWRGLFAGCDFPHPLLAVDLPAHGSSPHFVPQSLDEIAACIEATLASLGITSCLLVGHSLGGAVSAIVAARCVIDVQTLLLIAPAGLGAQINGDFLNGFLQAQSEASLKPWLKLLVEDERHLSQSFVKVTLGHAQDQLLRAAQKNLAQRFFADATQIFDIKAALAQIVAPIRIVFGAGDRIIPIAHTRGLPGKVALHIFPNCGHMPHIEERAGVLDILYQCARAR